MISDDNKTVPETLPPLDVVGLLREYELRPSKGLGQNFLVDGSALKRVVETAEIPTGASVLEIGPGLGSLTRWLALMAGQVVAVELDQHLFPVLDRVLSAYENVKLVHGDILELDPADLMEKSGYLVVANIPYYITSALIRHLLESEKKPSRMVLTVQREVAARICALPGELSLLALSVQVYGTPRVVARIPAGAFYPAPRVDSAVVRVDLFPEPMIPIPNLKTFFKLAKAGFSQKRKMLRNTLAASLHWKPDQAAALLKQAGIDPQRRAETVSLEEWASLTQCYLQE